jgi:hypothetical protein
MVKGSYYKLIDKYAGCVDNKRQEAILGMNARTTPLKGDGQ